MSIPLPPLPGWAYHTVHELRARDQEIVRCVLEAAAKVARNAYLSELAGAIRALEFTHHE